MRWVPGRAPRCSSAPIVPALTAAHLETAFVALDSADWVFAPAQIGVMRWWVVRQLTSSCQRDSLGHGRGNDAHPRRGEGPGLSGCPAGRDLGCG